MKRLILAAVLVPAVAWGQYPGGDEAAFLQTVEQYRSEFDAATTIQQQSDAISQRNQQLCRFASTMAPWSGVVSNLTLNQDGSVNIAIEIGPNIFFAAVNLNPLQFPTLNTMKVGDTIRFTAVINREGGYPCTEDVSPDAQTFMDSPEFETTMLQINPGPGVP